MFWIIKLIDLINESKWIKWNFRNIYKKSKLILILYRLNKMKPN